MSRSIFSSNDDEVLVEEVGKHPELYDSSHAKHKEAPYKDDIWNSISSIVGKPSKSLHIS